MPKNINLNQKTAVLVVTIGDKTYKLPLATSLPYKKVKALIKLSKKEDEFEQLDAFIDFFKEYIPEDVIEDLPVSALNQLASAWSGASEKESGQELGES